MINQTNCMILKKATHFPLWRYLSGSTLTWVEQTTGQLVARSRASEASVPFLTSQRVGFIGKRSSLCFFFPKPSNRSETQEQNTDNVPSALSNIKLSLPATRIASRFTVVQSAATIVSIQCSHTCQKYLSSFYCPYLNMQQTFSKVCTVFMRPGPLGFMKHVRTLPDGSHFKRSRQHWWLLPRDVNADTTDGHIHQWILEAVVMRWRKKNKLLLLPLCFFHFHLLCLWHLIRQTGSRLGIKKKWWGAGANPVVRWPAVCQTLSHSKNGWRQEIYSVRSSFMIKGPNKRRLTPQNWPFVAP